MDISLALGGGGAKGNSHIGVIRRLEKEGFRIRAVAGTSFGGIVAALYAFGKTPDQIEELFSSVDQARLYGHTSGEGPSLLGLAGASKLFDEVFGARTFDDLSLPCGLTAVDLKSAREVILTEGLVRDALLGTIALPGIFPPRHIQDWELVDGGTLDPVPVSVARLLAPNLPVVAVVLSSPVGEPARTFEVSIPYLPDVITRRITRMRPAQAFDIFLQAVNIGNSLMSELRLEKDDPEIIIRPAVKHIQLMDKVDVHEVARLGEQAVESVLPDLRPRYILDRALGTFLWEETSRQMNVPAVQGRSFFQGALHLTGLCMPYFTVWLGLYVLKNAWAAILGYHIGILLLVTLAGAWPSLEKFRPGAPLWKIILFSLTGGIAGLAVYILWPVIHVSPGLTGSLLEWGLGPGSWPLFIIYSALVNPWLEEIYWRNWLGSAQAHPVFTDAVFGGFHLIILAPFFSPFWLVVVFIILTASGWMWRQVIRTGNSMLASTLFHMVADVSILLVIWSTVGSWYET